MLTIVKHNSGLSLTVQNGYTHGVWEVSNCVLWTLLPLYHSITISADKGTMYILKEDVVPNWLKDTTCTSPITVPNINHHGMGDYTSLLVPCIDAQPLPNIYNHTSWGSLSTVDSIAGTDVGWLVDDMGSLLVDGRLCYGRVCMIFITCIVHKICSHKLKVEIWSKHTIFHKKGVRTCLEHIFFVN